VPPASKRTPERFAKLFEALELGSTRRAACAAAGFSYHSLSVWMTEDPNLRDQVEQAEGRAEHRCLEIVMEAAPKDWKAAAWWLERRRREDYGKQLDLSKLSPDQLLALLGAIPTSGSD